MKDCEHHMSKSIKSEILPNRHALTEVTKGATMPRVMNNYAKNAPDMLSPFGMGILPSPSPRKGKRK